MVALLSDLAALMIARPAAPAKPADPAEHGAGRREIGEDHVERIAPPDIAADASATSCCACSRVRVNFHCSGPRHSLYSPTIRRSERSFDFLRVDQRNNVSK